MAWDFRGIDRYDGRRAADARLKAPPALPPPPPFSWIGFYIGGEFGGA